MNNKSIQYFLSSFYRYLGRLVARHSFLFLLLPVVCTLLLSLGILRITVWRDLFILFTPSNGRSIRDRNVIKELFPLNESTEYDGSRTIDEGMYGIFIISALDGKSLFREHIYKELRDLDKTIRNFTVPWKDKYLNYSSLCATNYGRCSLNYGLFDNETLLKFKNGLFSMKYPVDINMMTYKVTPYAQSFGGVTVDEDGYVKDILAYRLIYILDSGRIAMKDVMNEWERKVFDIVKDKKFTQIRISMVTTNSQQRHSKQFTEKVIPLGGISAFVIIAFCMLANMTTNWIRSKPWLGISGCISSMLATVSSFGIVMLCGVSYIDLNIALPFLLIGMGVDDSFVLLAAWRRSKEQDTVEKRMEDTYSEAAVSITITSITNFISFCVGIVAPFPVVSIFCIYAATGVLFTFFYQITFFGSCIAFTGYREDKNIHPFTCQRIKNGKDPSGNRRNLTTETKLQSDRIMKGFGSTLGRYLTKCKIKVLVFFVYFSILSIGIWGITQVKEGLDTSQILPTESSGYKYMKDQYKYFSKYAHRIHVVINTPLNYAESSVQKQIEDTLKSFEANELIADPSLTESWLRAFKMFMDSPLSSFSLGAFNLSAKQDFINGLRVFLRFPQTKHFLRDVVFNENYTEIVSSRFFLLCNEVRDKKEEKDLIESVWSITDKSELSIVTYSFWFPFYEQLTAIRPAAIQTVCIAVVVTMLVFFLFIPKIIFSVCVAFTILTVELEVIGFMSLWDVSLDIFSLINLIMCVGFSINYPAHITYAYIASDFSDQDFRLQNSLYAVGLPILQGSLSTVLGVSILMIDSSYMFIVFGKIVCLVVCLTAVHSIFFLPVILNICDKYFCCNVSSRTTVKEELTEKQNSLLT